MDNIATGVWQPNASNKKLKVTNIENAFVLCLAYSEEEESEMVDFAIYQVRKIEESSGKLWFGVPNVYSPLTENLFEGLPLLEGIVKTDGGTQFSYSATVQIYSHRDLALLHMTIETARKIALTELLPQEHILYPNEYLVESKTPAAFKDLFRGFKPTWEKN